MLEKFRSLLKDNIVNTSFDPSQFEDQIAKSTEWTPLKSGGSNFHTHRMAANGSHRMEFRATLGTRLFAFAFIVMGLGIIILLHTVGFEDDQAQSFGSILLVWLFGLVFAGSGWGLWYVMGKPRIFDKHAGMYWHGHKKPDSSMNRDTDVNHHSAALFEIHAIQLIREYIRSDKNSYYSYELNLILKNGNRINVIDHGNKSEILHDATKLGEFLGIPVWKTFN